MPEPEDLLEIIDAADGYRRIDLIKFYRNTDCSIFVLQSFLLAYYNLKRKRMKEEKLDEKDLQRLKELLIHNVASNADKNFQKDNHNATIWKNYAASDARGHSVYESFTDEELLDYIRAETKRLNHAPAQKELFWVMRDYIKRRFKRWPYAMKAAGLTASTGKGGKTLAQIEEDNKHLEWLLAQVREKALELGKIPHPKDIPDVCAEIKKYYNDWGKVIEAAEIDPHTLNEEVVYKIEGLEPQYVQMLDNVKSFAYELGRSPIHGEIDTEVKRALIRRCGSWRNALYQVGLEPVIRIRPFHGIYIDYRKENNRDGHTNSLYNCYYRVLNLSEEDKRDLEQVRTIYQQTRVIPTKKDVSKELRLRLQEACGSWANVLYQIGIDPKEYHRTIKGGKTNEK